MNEDFFASFLVCISCIGLSRMKILAELKPDTIWGSVWCKRAQTKLNEWQYLIVSLSHSQLTSELVDFLLLQRIFSIQSSTVTKPLQRGTTLLHSTKLLEDAAQSVTAREVHVSTSMIFFIHNAIYAQNHKYQSNIIYYLILNLNFHAESWWKESTPKSKVLHIRA